MNFFAYEYTCATAGRGQIAPSLAAEGRAMWRAILQDLAGIRGARVVTLVHEEFDPGVGVPGVHCERTREEEPAFRGLAGKADFTLVIAPEFHDLLATRCRWVLESGGQILGPAPSAVQLAGDKLALADHLRRHGVPTPSTVPAVKASFAGPLVCKPRHGAGSLATRQVMCFSELMKQAAIVTRELAGDDAIVQPFVVGLPASVALLIGPRQTVPLLAGMQRLSEDGLLHYQGGRMPLEPTLAQRAVDLAVRAVATIPELRGYAGVDLILGEACDGSGDRVIEINPRLTTSYLGLRALSQGNLAEAMIQCVCGEDVHLAWRDGVIEFTADGTITPFSRETLASADSALARGSRLNGG